MDNSFLLSELKSLRSQLDSLIDGLSGDVKGAPSHIRLVENGGERVVILDGVAFYAFRRGRGQKCGNCPFEDDADCRREFTLCSGEDFLTCKKNCFVFFQPQSNERSFMLSQSRVVELAKSDN